MARRSGIYAGGIAALLMVTGVGMGSASGAQHADALVEVFGVQEDWNKKDVTIAVGESVTWRWTNTDLVHNVLSASPNWTIDTPAATTENVTRQFTTDGTYLFRCEFHVNMTGRIVVGTGVDPTATPTASPTATPTATPTASATASPTATPVTPAATPVPTAVVPTPTPVSPAGDTTKPTLKSVKYAAVKRGVKVSFRLSESASVKVAVKRGSKTLKTVTKRLSAGARSVTATGAKVTRGKVSVEIRATDAAGNASALARRSVSIRR